MKDTLERAAWTAAEAFLAILLPALTTDIIDADKVKAVGIAAAIAALAAFLTVLKQGIKNAIAPPQ